MSRVDAIIPCYNYAAYLRDSVMSVLAQEGVEVRVLIIDDASTDDTPQVGAELAAADSRVEYRRHTENRGHIATYNEGLEWASGDYTLLLSADDMLTPGALGRAARLMDAHPEVGFVYGRNIRLVTGQPLKPPQSTALECDWQIWEGWEWLEAVCRERSTFIDSPEVLVRTRMYKTLGGYRKELPHTADVEMWLRFAAHGAVGKVDADQAYYRVHGQNMHTHLAPTALRSLEHWNAAFDTFFRHYGDGLPDGTRLQQLAGASLACLALEAAYSPKHGRDRAACRQLIDFAVRVCPAVRSLRGRCWAGYYGSRTLAYWATRTLFGVPIYLFRLLARDGGRLLRFCLSANGAGAAFALGRITAHLKLIAGAWFGQFGRRTESALRPGPASSPA